MSTQSEFEQIAVRLPADQVSSRLCRDDDLVLMVRGGDNNCIGPDGRIHRAWYVVQRHAFSVTDPEQMALFNEMHDLGLGPWSRKVYLHTPKPARSNPASLTRERAGISPVSAANQPV